MRGKRITGTVWWQAMWLAILAQFTVLPSQGGYFEDEASTQWLNAFVLVNTADSLGEQHAWSLALAGYLAAHDLLEEIASRYPDFEPQLVAFRLKHLKSKIRSATEAMEAGEHDIAMQYVDFIETSNRGTLKRISLDYAAAYQLFAQAQWHLNEVIESNPERFSVLLSKQRDHLESLAEKTRDEILKLPDGARVLYEVDRQFKTEVAMKPLTLPGNPEIPPTSALFP